MLNNLAVVVLFVASVQGAAISYISHDLGYAPIAIAKPVITYSKPIAIAKQEVVDYSAPAHYEFKYGVDDAHTGDKKQHSESRIGDTVKGEYSLAEPDGTIRVVKYTADPHNGFNAVVSRIGKAVHPQIVHKIVQPVVAKTLISAPVVDHGYGLDLYH